MKLRHMFAAVAILGLLTSCQSMLAMLTPKAEPAMVAQVMAKADEIRFSPARKLGKSKNSRMALKAGQWVTTLTRDTGASGNVTLSTTRIISISGSTVVMETESYSALDKCERQLAQITLANYPVKGALSYSQAEYDNTIQTIKIIKLVTKTGDQPVQEMPEQLLVMSQHMAKNIAAASVRSGDMITDACKTDYLDSSLCYSFNYSVSVMGITRSGKSVNHSEIPVNGLIHMDSQDMVMETIAFGTSGAKSQL